MQFLWKYIDDLIGKGLEMNVIAEFLVYTSASLVPMAMPLAVLLASLMTFGNLAENLELLALKSSGISLIRIMAPVMSFTAAEAWEHLPGSGDSEQGSDNVFLQEFPPERSGGGGSSRRRLTLFGEVLCAIC